MSLKRAVITGIGAVSPLGSDVVEMLAGLDASRSAVRFMEGWNAYKGLRSLVAAPAKVKEGQSIPRQSRRSMGPISIYSVQASQEAIKDSSLSADILKTGRVGCIIGSTMGSAKSINDVYENMTFCKDLSQITSMKFFQCVSHTAALNVSQFLALTGLLWPRLRRAHLVCRLLVQRMIFIRLGSQDVVLCGGAEELFPTVTGSFDILLATSTKYNDRPELTPRPFDADRDGLVCGEGAGILVVEEYEHARVRGAKIYAEIIGYHTCASGLHVSQSSKDALVASMQGALSAAKTNVGGG